jgi:hypothetical protein
MRLQHPGLIFKVMQRRDPAMIPGTAPAQSSDEVPVVESCADDAVCMYDYEISNETLTRGLVAIIRSVDHISGIGAGRFGGLAGLCHWL